MHEQIVYIQNKTIETFDIPIEIEHDGYEGTLEQRRKKIMVESYGYTLLN